MESLDLARRLRKMQVQVRRSQTKIGPLYIESTWTPTYIGATTAGVTTYSTQQGVYTRIGNFVLATGAVAWTNATGTGNAIISLPITGQAGLNQSGAQRLVNVTFANGSAEIEFAGTQFFAMRSPATNAGGTVIQVEVAGNIIFTVAYLI